MAVYMLFSTSLKNYLLVIFLLPSLAIFVSDSGGFSFATVLLLFGLIKHIFSRFDKMRISILGLSATILLVIYELAHVFEYSTSMVLPVLRWGALFIYASLIVIDINFKIDFKRVTYAFVSGIFVSSLCGYIMSLVSPSTSPDNPNVINRFEGLGGDPNGFGMMILIAMLFLMNIYKNSYKGKQKHLYIAVILVLLGLTTFSRSYLITAGMMITIVTVHNLIFSRTKRTRVRLRLIAFSIIIIGVFFKPITSMLETTIGRLTQANNIGEVTGERSLLAQLYWSKFTDSSMYDVIFGNGIIGYLKAYNVTISGNNLGPHNTYLELIASWGLVGIILFIFYLVAMFKCCQLKANRKQPYFLGFLSFVCLLIYLTSLQSLAKYNTYFYISMILMSMFLIEERDRQNYIEKEK
jgi:hypothetical protein